jgi:hypothetical protein
MKTLIFFREGLSGHYLKSLVDDVPAKVNFRMDPWYPGIYIEKNQTSHVPDCVCMHNADLTFEQQFNLVLIILVNKKIYHAIYNNFFKKFLVEDANPDQYKNWKDNLSFWYDKSFYNIKEYYILLTLDQKNNKYENVVDFDEILNEQYLQEFFKRYFNRELSDNMRSIIKQYSVNQLEIELTREGTTMREIIDPIPDNKFNCTPWFASYCIFKYETNNNLKETQRLWSIDDINYPIDKKFLLDIQNKYL